jgi:hypothetical protein
MSVLGELEKRIIKASMYSIVFQGKGLQIYQSAKIKHFN